MNIHSQGSYPSSTLSNFAGNGFVVFGMRCYSMEGFLQGLKFASPEIQKHVCTLGGRAAKRKGADKKWFRTQKLWLKGEEIDRHSERYQDILNMAYNAMYLQSKTFRDALKNTQKAVLTHSIGKKKTSDTILTVTEFCSRLMKLRDVGVLEVNDTYENKAQFLRDHGWEELGVMNVMNEVGWKPLYEIYDMVCNVNDAVKIAYKDWKNDKIYDMIHPKMMKIWNGQDI